MTTRRGLLSLPGGVLGAVVLAGCERSGGMRDAAADSGAAGGVDQAARAVPAAVPDPLVIDTSAGLAALRGTARRTAGRSAVLSLDGRTIVSAVHLDRDRTRLETVDAAGARVLRQRTVAGRWVPRVVSPAGMVALTAPVPAVEGSRPAGADRTTVLVFDDTGERARHTVAGNVEPDAFSTDGTALFLLDWLPATAPDRYRVRRLDLATGQVGPLLTRDKTAIPAGAEEEMRGERRQSVPAPGAGVLYTLYTHQRDHRHTRDIVTARPGGAHAFVHTLGLDIGWAYCLDLPAPLGTGPTGAHALAIAPDGRTLFVADLSGGHLAAADTGTLAVRRVARIPAGGGTAHAAVAPHGRTLFLAAGTRVSAVDVASLGVQARWDTGARVCGLALDGAGSRLYVGRPDGVQWRDPAGGTVLGHASVPGLTGLRAVA